MKIAKQMATIQIQKLVRKYLLIKNTQERLEKSNTSTKNVCFIYIQKKSIEIVYIVTSGFYKKKL